MGSTYLAYTFLPSFYYYYSLTSTPLSQFLPPYLLFSPFTIIPPPLPCHQQIHSMSVSVDGTVVALGLDQGAVALCQLSRDGSAPVQGTLQAHPGGVGPVAALDMTIDGT